jgi:hypothetical protein
MKKVLAIGGVFLSLWGFFGDFGQQKSEAAVRSPMTNRSPIRSIFTTGGFSIGRFDPSVPDRLPVDNSVDPIPAIAPNPSPSINPIESNVVPTPSGTASPPIPNGTGQSPAPTVLSTPAPVVIPSVLRELPNNPLVAPQNIEDLLKMRMTEDLWQAMYAPLPCLDTTADCVQRLQNEAVQNSPVLKGLDERISTINQKIEEANTNNRKSIELAVFEPALQVFLRQETVVENGQVRKIGIIERVGQLFSNPGPVINDLLGAIGIPVLRGVYGGSDAQQSRSIQISDLVVKVAEMERGKTEVAAKTKERVQQMVLEFDTFAREFQAEQAIARMELNSWKLYAIAYGSGEGDTDSYLNRKEKLERSRLQVFKSWGKVRSQITLMKAVVVPEGSP